MIRVIYRQLSTRAGAGKTAAKGKGTGKVGTQASKTGNAAPPGASPASLQDIKLTLAPRGVDRDLQILRTTFASFSELLQAQRELVGGEAALDASVPLGGSTAERVLDECTAQGLPRPLLHLLMRLDGKTHFSLAKSKEALRMVRQKGSAVDLRQLRRALQPRESELIVSTNSSVDALLQHSVAEIALPTPTPTPTPTSTTCRSPLQLDVGDIDDTISLCVQRGDLDEAMKWFLTMQDCLHLRPAESTCSLLLPTLIRRKKWEALFYLLGEMRVLDITVPPRAYDLLLRECEGQPRQRWQYVQPLLSALLDSKATTSGKEERLISRSVQRSLATLSADGQHAAVIVAWTTLRRFLNEGEAGISRTVLVRDKQVVNTVGVSAVVLKNVAVLEEILESDGERKEGETMLEYVRRSLTNNMSKSSRRGNGLGMRSGVGLGWLLAHGEAEAAKEIFDALALKGEDLSDFLFFIASCLGDSGIATADLEAACVIVSAALSSEPAVQVSEPLVSYLISLFGKTQDVQATTRVLLLAADQGLALSEKAFIRASQTLLQRGDLPLVLRLFESYLLQLDSSSSSSDKLAICSNVGVFSPALSALAQLGELDVMMTLLLKEMPKRRCSPSPLLYVIAINACRRAGRFDQGFRLFELATQSNHLLSKNSTSESVVARNDLPALISSTLQCCADGRMGKQALRVVAWVDESFPSLSVLNSEQGTREANLELVVTALATPQTIAMLPSFLEIVRTGPWSLGITRRLYVVCLSAAISASNEAVYQALLAQKHDREIELFRDEIVLEARRLSLEKTQSVEAADTLALEDEH